MPKPLNPPPTAPPPPKPHRPLARRAHGGAWKVAYADFVTALMALFIVLWLMNASVTVKQSVTGYFSDPVGYTRKLDAQGNAPREGSRLNRESAASLQQLIEQALRKMPEFPRLREHVKLSVTPDGLRIDLMEGQDAMFFVSGNAQPTANGESLLRVLAAEISRMPNAIVVEGHTDAHPFRNATSASLYGNWELSTDRANSARRMLCAGGIPPGRVVEVRGFADQRLLDPAAPDSPRNRRISIVVRLADTK